MADNTVNTNLNFETNASEVTQEVNGLDSAIDKTTQSIKDNTNASDKNEEQYKTLKAQFYRVVEREYNQFVCYPGGKLPIPIDVPYPAPSGSQKYFKGFQAQ